MIIDVHTHLFPDNIALQVAKSVEQVLGMQSPYPGTLSQMQGQMTESGVDYSIAAGVATEARNVAGTNRWLTGLPPQFIPFATVHPDGDLEEQLKQIKQPSFKGIKLHPIFQKFIPDDPRLFPLYEDVGEKLVFLIHMGGGSEESNTRLTPLRLAQLMKMFPRIRVIAAHFGGIVMDGIGILPEIEEHLVPLNNVFFDTVWPPVEQVPVELILKLVSKLGAERLLFGTDCPHTYQRNEVAYWRNLPLAASDRDGIMGRNASGLLGL